MISGFRIFDKISNEYDADPKNKWLIDDSGKLFLVESYPRPTVFKPAPDRYAIEYRSDLVDRDGAPIYENDLLSITGKYYWKVVRGKSMWLKTFNDVYCSSLEKDLSDFKVIGNIHQKNK